ncbi:MAG: PLD nuclease N-terminal domain-containing protein [Chloroflexi bacterium]|nr:PLD nuclease N-terminal domain-containing protein [Chloroflexota bacterium]
MTDLSTMTQYLPLIIPIAVLQFGLMFTALIDLVRRKKTKGPVWMWILVIVLINLFGPIAYFMFGRRE